MKKHFLALTMLLILTIPVGAVEIKNMEQAINVAGKQRMLTQRMLADFVLIGMHSNFKNPKGDLAKVMSAFDDGLGAIKHYTQNKKIQTLLSTEQKVWREAKKELVQKPTAEVCKGLCDHLDRLLHLSNNIVVELKKESGTNGSEIIDLSGRQRMLSQRIAGLYILNLWAKGNSAYKKNLDEAMALFKKSMGRLKTYKKNTEEIKQLLAEVEKTYHYFEMMNEMETPMETMPSLAYKKLDDMLVNMDKVTQLYASLK